MSKFLPRRFYQQVCSHLHLFILLGDAQAQRQLPSTLFLRLLQLAVASTDRYEPWDQDSLVSVARHRLEGAQSPRFEDGEPSSCPRRSSRPVLKRIRTQASLSRTSLSPLLPFCPPSCAGRGPLFFLIPQELTRPG